ncbi:hypothetical protein HPB47_012053 [Ixodes persulcatus]|uniref:Uncharacterized protein n=1 Tax=Ixodes persulcatus TaxID=34615 RepID=A0AC60NUN6_IXOPE|nr:hypothetical protein HPB47_012053 [Ixodes persulcatus]
MAGTFSKCRLFCPDYARRHKSKIEYQRNFRKVSDLDFELLKRLLPAEQAASVNGDDSICKNCFAMFKRDLQDFVKEQRRVSLGDAAVEEEQAMIEDVKEVISAANVILRPATKMGHETSRARRVRLHLLRELRPLFGGIIKRRRKRFESRTRQETLPVRKPIGGVSSAKL